MLDIVRYFDLSDSKLTAVIKSVGKRTEIILDCFFIFSIYSNSFNNTNQNYKHRPAPCLSIYSQKLCFANKLQRGF